MAKPFRIEEKRAGAPIPMFVGEHALEHENLLPVGMIMLRKPRVWLVAHDGGNLARLRRPHQVDSLPPDGPARTRRPLHPSRIGHGPHGKIPVDCLIHGVLFSRDWSTTVARSTILPASHERATLNDASFFVLRVEALRAAYEDDGGLVGLATRCVQCISDVWLRNRNS